MAISISRMGRLVVRVLRPRRSPLPHTIIRRLLGPWWPSRFYLMVPPATRLTLLLPPRPPPRPSPPPSRPRPSITHSPGPSLLSTLQSPLPLARPWSLVRPSPSCATVRPSTAKRPMSTCSVIRSTPVPPTSIVSFITPPPWYPLTGAPFAKTAVSFLLGGVG